MTAAKRPVGVVADRHLLRRRMVAVLERRGGAVVPRPGGAQRRRHDRVLPPLGRHQHRRHLRHPGLSRVSTRPEAAASTAIIEGLNRVLDIAVPGENQEGGTVVIPGRGRLSDETDVANYRDMVTIVRDRVREMAAKGMSLEQVRRAKPTSDYDGLYGGRRLDERDVRGSRVSRRERESAMTGLRRGVASLRRCVVLMARCSVAPAAPAQQGRGAGRPSCCQRARAARCSISPVSGCRSSTRTGGGGWSRRRKAIRRAFRSIRPDASGGRVGSGGRPSARRPVQGVRSAGADSTARPRSASGGRTTTRCSSSSTPARRRGACSSVRTAPRRAVAAGALRGAVVPAAAEPRYLRPRRPRRAAARSRW